MKIDILSFTQTLSSLLSTNITLQDALKIGSEIEANKKNKRLCLDLLKNIKEGFLLSETMKKYPLFFNSFYNSLVSIGEETGSLVSVFEKLALYLKTKKERKTKVVQSLLYPSIVLFSAIVVILIVVFFVFPQMEEIFSVFTQEAEGIKKQMIKIKANIFLILGLFLFILLTALIIKYLRGNSEKVRFFTDSVLLKIPVVKKIIIINQTTDFAFAMKLLIESHFTFSQSMKQAAQVLSNEKYKWAILSINEEIVKGRSVGECFEQYKLLPPYLNTWIKVSEYNGDVKGVFSQIYEYYSRENTSIVNGIVIILEPLFTILTGLIVLLIISQFVIPIFKLMGEI